MRLFEDRRLLHDLRSWWNRQLFRWDSHSFYLLWEAMLEPGRYPLLRQYGRYRYPWAVLDLPEGISVLVWGERQWCCPWMVIYRRRSMATLRDWLESMPDYDTFAAACQLVGHQQPVVALVNMPLPHEEESSFGPEHFTPVVTNDAGMAYLMPYDPTPTDLLPEPLIELLVRLRRWKRELVKAEVDAYLRQYQKQPDIGQVWIEPDGWLCYIDERGTLRRIPRKAWESHLFTADGQFVANGAWVHDTEICWIDRHTGKMQRHRGIPVPR